MENPFTVASAEPVVPQVQGQPSRFILIVWNILSLLTMFVSLLFLFLGVLVSAASAGFFILIIFYVFALGYVVAIIASLVISHKKRSFLWASAPVFFFLMLVTALEVCIFSLVKGPIWLPVPVLIVVLIFGFLWRRFIQRSIRFQQYAPYIALSLLILPLGGWLLYDVFATYYGLRADPNEQFQSGSLPDQSIGTNNVTGGSLKGLLQEFSPRFIPASEVYGKDSLVRVKIMNESINLLKPDDRVKSSTDTGDDRDPDHPYSLLAVGKRYVLLYGQNLKWGGQLYIIDANTSTYTIRPYVQVLDNAVSGNHMLFLDLADDGDFLAYDFLLYTLDSSDLKKVPTTVNKGETINSEQGSVDAGDIPKIRTTENAFYVSVFREVNTSSDDTRTEQSWSNATRKLREITIFFN